MPGVSEEGLSLTLRCDQHRVGGRRDCDADGENGAEGGVPGPASVESEHELVEVGLQVLGPQAVVDAERPGLEVGEYAVDPGQHDMGGHLADDARVVGDVGGARVACPAVGLGGGAGGEVCGEEGVQAAGGEVRDLRQAYAAWAAIGAAVADLDGAGDEQLALVAAAAAAGRRVVLGAAGDRGLVDLDQAGQGRALGRDHGAAQLGTQQPGALVGAEAELLLDLQGRDAVGVGGHQVGGPEPDGERQLGAVHHGAGRHRGLPVAVGALVGVRLGRQCPASGAAAGRAHEALRPAHLPQVRGTGCLIGKAPLELQQRAGKVGHRGALRGRDVRVMFYHEPHTASPHLVAPELWG